MIAFWSIAQKGKTALFVANQESKILDADH